MALLDEQLVEQWLNANRFFTIRGIKCGIDEIDFLAVRPSLTGFECWHVEVQVSFRPVGYIGGDTNARRRTEDELRAGVEQWVAKKFTSPKKVSKRNEILTDANWSYVLVCAELKDEAELGIMEQLGVRVVRYKDVLNELKQSSKHQSSSVSNNILEILRYIS